MICGRCGKPIKNPKSVRTGLGRECRRKLNFELTIKKIKLRCKHNLYCSHRITEMDTMLKTAKARFEAYMIPWDDESESFLCCYKHLKL